MQNHFDLFQLPQQFSIDVAALDAAYREVQGRVHPDRFVNAGDADKRVALQWATQANEAYQALKNPLKRATYLCELNGVDLNTETNTAMPPAFLMQQMEWREALQQARTTKDLAALESLEAELVAVRRVKMRQIEMYLEARDFTQAAEGIRQAMFLEKFGEELSMAFDAIGN